MVLFTTTTHRPRNVNAFRAGGILYGDWGTSKAYVVGLAFALVGYSSFWLIAAVSLLSIMIGVNYITVCKYYPSGGGVYASVRHRSPIISMVGAFFLTADFLVTASLSALSAAYYFGVPHPVLFAALALGVIGLLNFYGPKHMGTVAFAVVVLGFCLLTLLAALCIPFLKQAWSNIEPLKGPPEVIWRHFVGVIVALSGVEAIANATGVMKLDPGSTLARPSVKKTAGKAICSVMLEVALYTSLFGFAVAAISGFEFSGGTVNAPGNPEVRDYMLRYMGQVFGTTLFGVHFGQIFSWCISITVGIMLLSAVNTAFNGLISLHYLMAGDEEMPRSFQRLNRFGVPLYPLMYTALICIVLVLTLKDIEALAALYAIGFVGAIATNLGSTSTDSTLPMRLWERALMFVGFLIMLAVEVTLFIDKPHARNFAIAVILVGLILRGVAKEFKFKKILQRSREPVPVMALPLLQEEALPAILCPVDRIDKTLEIAIQKSKIRKVPLHILFIREQKVISESDFMRTWQNDEEAVKVFDFVQEVGDPNLTRTYYSVSDSKADMIAAYALRLNATQLYIGMPSQGALKQILWGNLVRDLSLLLPEEIEIYVIP